MPGVCINLKVVGILGAVALAIVVLEPRLALAALPILVIAACPLSCLFMMRGMGRQSSSQMSAGSMTGENERISQLEAEIQGLRAERVPLREVLGEPLHPPVEIRPRQKV